MTPIVVNHLKKSFFTSPPITGSIFQRIKKYCVTSHNEILAVNNISFSIKAGERVAFIGPNGAGKSTTLKILTGIMKPTAGEVRVLGKDPAFYRRALGYHIGAVFGQRSQLWYHLPVLETLSLLAAIYDIPHAEHTARLKRLAQKFDIAHLLDRTVSQLSLGERMRCEIVASLLHKPTVLFLDEPTIGLDVNAKAIIRDLIRQESDEAKTTFLLTSHDTDDIEKVCDRVIVIDQGRILLDDSLINLKKNYIQKKLVTIVTEESTLSLEPIPGTAMVEQSPHHIKIEVDLTKQSIEKVMAKLLEQYTVKDLTVEAPPLETIIRMLYQHETL